MALNRYQTWKNKIAYRLYTRTGFSLSESRQIANNVVEKVKQEGGGGNWTQIVDYGEHSTSKYRTLREFVNVLSNSSFGISKTDVQELQKKFSTGSAIEAVNSFCIIQSQSQVQSQVQQFQQNIGSPVNNSSLFLQLLQKSFLAKTLARIKVTIAEMMANMSAFSVATNVLRLSAMFMGSFGFITDNEAVVGFLPLGGMGIDSPCSVQNIEVAHTNQQVKFRAVGSIFLANQQGGMDAIKITGKLQGPMRFYWLTMLWLLTLVSSGTTEILNWDDEFVNANASLQQVRDFGSGPPSLTTIPTLQKGKQSLLAAKPSYERHITFPVILSHEIILNCYVETFSFEEKVKEGKDIITYDLLLRTYKEPEEFIANAQKGIFQLKQPTQTQNSIQYAINFAYRTAKQVKESVNIDLHTYKVENYYDVDLFDLGQVMFLKLAGVAG
jgi:hypothetical protein